MYKTVWILVMFVYVIWKSDAKIEKGRIHTSSSWEFVTRFVFLNEGGKLEYTVEYPLTNECCPSLVFYYDDHRSEVYPRPDMGCLSKMRYASKYYGSNLQLKLDHSNSNGNCVDYYVGGKIFRQCSGQVLFTAMRARWWFLVLSNCDNTKSSPLHNVNYVFTVKIPGTSTYQLMSLTWWK